MSDDLMSDDEGADGTGASGVREEMTTLLFEPGQLVSTPAALAAIGACGRHPLEYVKQNVTGNWGNLDAEDTAYNWWAVKHAARLLSSYRLPDGKEVWVITEEDRTTTTLLLPEEY